MRPLADWLRDGLRHTLDLDVKILRTLGLLFRHPGRLTLDYIEGRRAFMEKRKPEFTGS